MKTSYLIIGGIALAAGAYWYTHRKTPASSPPPATTATPQSTTSKVLNAVGASLQSFSTVFKSSPATSSARTTTGADDVAYANATHLEIDNRIQL